MWYDLVDLESILEIYCALREMAQDVVFLGRLLCVCFLGMIMREVGADGDIYTPADLHWKTLDVSSMLIYLVYSYSLEAC